MSATTKGHPQQPAPQNTAELLHGVQSGQLQFADVLTYIAARYKHQATAYRNGEQSNSAAENQGACRVLAFAQLHGLSPAQALSLFAEHWRGVQADPNGQGHPNIRQFMQHGWAGLHFDAPPLQAK